MLKLLTIGGAPILLAAVVSVTVYDKLHDTEGKGYDLKCTESSDPATTVGTLVCTAEHEQKAQTGQYDPMQWHVFIAWPEGITALLLMFTLCAIAWQGWETRKAAGAGRDAAKASLKQANHLAATERAWIKVTPHVAKFTFRPKREDTDPVPENLAEVIPIAHQFPARIENVGKTPAKIVGSGIRYKLSRMHPSDYPPVPDYGPISKFETYVFPKAKDVVFAGRLEPTATLTVAQIKSIEDREQFLLRMASSNTKMCTGIRTKRGSGTSTRPKSGISFKWIR